MDVPQIPNPCHPCQKHLSIYCTDAARRAGVFAESFACPVKFMLMRSEAYLTGVPIRQNHYP